ncbi:hypothetical protein GO986_02915 [Deinococcus sp. HMF7620]|uniref:Uncharacterized protein n=1 Tax=Deinococcus arboris TaxID=2682977 RepID=A0A7C9HW16_9DEIO|nr:hypothetical protein [Deinococcus arboris]
MGHAIRQHFCAVLPNKSCEYGFCFD